VQHVNGKYQNYPYLLDHIVLLIVTHPSKIRSCCKGPKSNFPYFWIVWRILFLCKSLASFTSLSFRSDFQPTDNGSPSFKVL